VVGPRAVTSRPSHPRISHKSPKWWRWALASAVLAGALVVGLAVPASAATVQVSMSVTPGSSFDLLCPGG
jgi:hypothetical protein